MKAFIIHGTFGHPQENWFPWLKEELEKLGFEVFVPAFPTPEGQSLESWMRAFEEFLPKVDWETIFVAHSIGPAFVLSVLERLEKPVKACFFVSGFVGSLGKREFDEFNDDIAKREFDWSKIRKNCGRFFLFHSDNDPYVPVEKARNLGRLLGARPIIVKGAGHFNEKAGYKEFPLLLEKIREFVRL